MNIKTNELNTKNVEETHCAYNIVPLGYSQMYLEPIQTTTTELFMKITSGLTYPLNIFAKKLYRRCSTGFLIHLLPFK